MPNIDIPFVRGQSEAVDPKLLPQGYFSSATNIRFKKDGRVGSRFGYTALRTSLVQAAGDFGPKRSIFITQRNGTTTPAGAIERHTDGTFTDLGSSSSTSFGTPFGGSNLTCPSRLAAVRNIKYTTVASDMIYDSGNKRLWVLANDYDYVNSIDNGVTLTVYDAAASGGGYTGFSLLKQLRVANTGFRNAKLVQVSTTIYAIGANGNNIDYAKFDAAALTAGATGTIVTAAAGRAFSFDISVNNQNPSASFLFCYESNGISLQFGTVVTNTMTFLNTATQAIANPVRPAITTGASNNHIYLVWAENAGFNAGNVFYREDIVNGANVTAKTTIDSSGLAVGFPVAGQNSSHNVSFCWNRSDSSTATYNTFSGMNLVAGLTVVSKPANLFAGACCAWYANYGTSGQTSRFGTYKLLDVESFAQSAMGAVCEAIACQHEALPGAYYVTSATNQDRMENRRNLVTVQSTLIESGTLAFATALPVLDRTRFGVDVIRAEYSPIGSRLLPGKINGQLIFSGARVFEFDGGNLFESGLADGPEYFTAADAGAGALGAGTYQYVALFEYKDAFGRRHQSPPSAPVSITIAASHNVTLSFQGPAFSSRLGPASPNTGAAAPGVTVAIYRTTQATPTIFQLVNSTQTIQVGASGHYDSTIYTYTDSTVDATIAANEILYTQGQRGGLSGLLQNDEPPPCRCLAIGNNRVLAAGLEDVQSYQFSKRIFPGEPLQWANNSAYKGRVDGDITGAWCLDGVYYVGTRDSIYVISGDGPDDNGAGGSFNDPVKLPADIGFYNQRSMVETPAGLFFQGRPDRIYLLPRGGGAPKWIGQPVRDTLATYPFITDAQLVQESNLVFFSCTNASYTSGVLLVFDTRIGEWSVDVPFGNPGTTSLYSFFYCMNVWDGKLMLNGASNQYSETSAYTDDKDGSSATSFVATAITGDVRPFGAIGWGRCRKATVLAEARDVSVTITPTLAVSYDSGKNFTDVSSWGTVASMATAIGDTITPEHMLQYPKNDAYRFKLSWTPSAATEGVVWNGLSLEVYPESGVKRQANASRG